MTRSTPSSAIVLNSVRVWKVPAGGGVEVVAEVLADLAAGRAQSHAVLLFVQAVLQAGQQVRQSLSQVPEDDLHAGMGRQANIDRRSGRLSTKLLLTRSLV